MKNKILWAFNTLCFILIILGNLSIMSLKSRLEGNVTDLTNKVGFLIDKNKTDTCLKNAGIYRNDIGYITDYSGEMHRFDYTCESKNFTYGWDEQKNQWVSPNYSQKILK